MATLEKGGMGRCSRVEKAALTARQAKDEVEWTGNIPSKREWLKPWETIKGDRMKGQTLGSKNDARAKKN